ncbi:MAG: DNA replication/repair protein RecF [Chloroflexi bacterium]|nr:DNA replication/repair protein RecF [Chloroflexota bacterium]
MARLAADAHADLAGGGEALSLTYLPRLDVGAEAVAGADREAVVETYAASLRAHLDRDVAAGMTLQGPHRDDLAFALNGEPAAGFASRAQQRTIALALRLAEARYLLSMRNGESPILLLDDVLSEMDSHRRRSVVEALAGYEQVLVTTTDLDRFPDGFLSGAALFSVAAGTVEPVGAGVTPRTGEG